MLVECEDMDEDGRDEWMELRNAGNVAENDDDDGLFIVREAGA